MSERISVIIPTYRNRGGVARSIESAINQDYPDVEIIVVDDNGLGTAFQIRTQEIVAKYPSIKYLPHKVNKNGAAARNTGLRAATGDYIAFLDDDDIFLPEKLTKQKDFLDNNPYFQACYCFALSSSGRPKKTIPFEGDVSKPLLLGLSSMYTPSLFFRKKTILEIGGFNESFRRHQDYELLLKYFQAGYKIGCLNEPLIQLGTNAGENILHGEDLENLKKTFLSTFSSVIEDLDIVESGLKNRIYASHYSSVFIDHLKTHHWRLAYKIFLKYFPKSPAIFLKRIYQTSIHQINRLFAFD